MERLNLVWIPNRKEDTEIKSNSIFLRVHPKKKRERIGDAIRYGRQTLAAKLQIRLKKYHSQSGVITTAKWIVLLKLSIDLPQTKISYT